ncbi:MAG: condensation domain-containing protein [Granulosicoccus sp.]
MFDGIDNAYPLTPLQEGILYEVLKSPDSDIYVAYVLIDIQGVLDESAFKQAWTETLNSHDTLRTRFIWEELDEPLQLVNSDASVCWESVDAMVSSGNQSMVDNTGVATLDEALIKERWLHHERTTSLSLSEQPPLRFRLIKFSPQRASLIWTVHHLLADDWSTPVVLKHVLEHYSAIKGDAAVVADDQPVALSFSDYVDWLGSADFSASEAWWNNKLHEALPTPLPVGQLSTNDASVDEKQFHPRLKRQLDEHSTQVVSAFSLQTGVTQSSLFHAAWALTLSQYAGSFQPLFGTSVSGRTCPLAGIESAVGLFLNTVPTQITIDAEQTPVAFASGVQAQLFDQMAHEHLPLSVLQSVRKSDSPVSLFESVLVVESHGANLNLASTNAEPIRFGEIRYETDSNYPLTVLVFPADQPEIHFLASASFIDAELLARMANSFTALLTSLCNRQHSSIRAVLSQHQALLHPDAVVPPVSQLVPRPSFNTMDKWLVDAALANLDATAVTHKGSHLSYGALLQRAVSLAKDIQGRSPQTECIGVYMSRSADQIVAVLAVMLSGRGYLALDVEWPAQRIQHMVQAANCTLVIAHLQELSALESLAVTALDISTQIDQQSKPAPGAENANATSNKLDVICTSCCGPVDKPVSETDKEKLIETIAELAGNNTSDDERLAYLIFTSGSTGTPKPVPVSHRNLLYSTAARIAYYPEQPTAYLLLSSLAFDSSVAGVFWTLCTGGTLVLQNNNTHNDVHELAQLIQRYKVSHTLCLPSLYALLLQYAAADSLKSLSTVIVAGEACPGNLPSHHRQVLPAAHLYNEYGPTEATVWASVACLHPKLRGDNAEPNAGFKEVAIGSAIPGCTIQIRDTIGNLCPAGITGEIVISSPGVVAGYRGESPVDALPFEPSTHADGIWGESRYYRSGDLGFTGPGGQLYFSGRVDEQVKIRGHRIEPAEVTWRVELLAGVHAAYCLPVSLPVPVGPNDKGVTCDNDDAATGNNIPSHTAPQLMCYVVPEGYETSGPCRLLDEKKLEPQLNRIASLASDCIAEQLPAYFAVSRFIAVSCLPRLPNGKIDKYGFPLPPASRPVHTSYEPLGADGRDTSISNNSTTARLCHLLEQQLNITGVCAQDNFFSLGGDSLSAIRFVARCREQGLGISIPMVSQFSTLDALGQALDKSAAEVSGTDTSKLNTAAFGDTPLTPIQRWFFSQEMPDPAHWNMGFTVTLAHSVDCTVLTRIIVQVVACLPVLGTRFTRHEGRWSAHIPEHVPVNNLVMRVQEPVDDDGWGAALAEAQSSFDLASGCLTGFVLAQSAAGDCQRIGVVLHHLVTDALSNQSLAGLLLQAISSGESPSQEHNPYRYWATQMSESFSASGEDTQDAPMPARWLESDVESMRFSIDKNLVLGLGTYCKTSGTDLHEAILFALMRAASCRASVQVDLEMHGRELMAELIDVSGTVGWFTCFYRVPSCDIDTLQATAFSRLIRQSREQGQEAFIREPERFFSEVQETAENTRVMHLPMLYNFLVGASTTVSKEADNTAGFMPVLDDRLRHPSSPRSHPVDCIVLDGERGNIDVLWRIDRKILQTLDINAWQVDFLNELSALCQDDGRYAEPAAEDFTDSGLQADELERLLEGFD